MSFSSRKLLTGLSFLLISSFSYPQKCTLTDYILRGVTASPALKDLSNQIQSNRYDSLIARATFLPQVNFNGYLMYAPVVNGWGYSDVITNGQNLITTMNVSQRIFNKGIRDAWARKYDLESGSLAVSKNISTNELRRAITSQYLAAVVAQEEQKFQLEVLTSLKNEAVILKSWTEKGIYRQTDYLSVQVEIMNLERNIRDLSLQCRKEQWNLNLICGIEDTSRCTLALTDIAEPRSKPTETSSYFKRFRIDSLQIRNEQLLIDRQYQPSVSWFADGGIVNDQPQYIYQNFGISVGLSMTLPVYDGNQRKINYQKIRTREDTRKNYQENFKFRYETQLRQLRSELENIRNLIKENQKQLVLVEELVNADRILLDNGSVPITDYILALKNLTETRHVGLLYHIRTQYILNEINFWEQ